MRKLKGLNKSLLFKQTQLSDIKSINTIFQLMQCRSEICKSLFPSNIKIIFIHLSCRSLLFDSSRSLFLWLHCASFEPLWLPFTFLLVTLNNLHSSILKFFIHQSSNPYPHSFATSVTYLLKYPLFKI